MILSPSYRSIGVCYFYYVKRCYLKGRLFDSGDQNKSPANSSIQLVSNDCFIKHLSLVVINLFSYVM
jgi:hypothetical protein